MTDTVPTAEPGKAPPPSVVMLRPLGNPLPLGFLGQALASWAFASFQLSWLSPAQSHTIALGVLVFTVPLQGLAALLGFLARDPVASTGPALLAGGWAAAAVATLLSPPGATSTAMGVLLVGVAGTLLVPATAALGRLAPAGVLILSVARFGVTGIAELLGDDGWLRAAGWLGLALAAISCYAAWAFELQASTGRRWLPVGRLSGRRTALTEEPGVRPTL